MVKSNIRYFKRIYFAVFILFAIICIGTAGFMLLEDYTFSEAFYMTIITVSTVGFSEVRELSSIGRFFTAFLIITSFGIFAYAITSITQYIASGEYKKYIKDYRVNKEIEKMTNHIIVCGYGRNGRQACKSLIARKQKFIVIENKPKLIEELKENELLYVEGDATDDISLKKAQINTAKALITTLPNDADNLFVVLSAREASKSITIISRASKDSSDRKLRIAGANNVIMPDKVGGDHMASLVTTPDVVEFLEIISIQGKAEINLEEINFNSIPSDCKGKTIRELEGKYKTGATIVGFKSPSGEYTINPGPDTELIRGSKLFVLGKPEQIKKLNDIFGIEHPSQTN